MKTGVTGRKMFWAKRVIDKTGDENETETGEEINPFNPENFDGFILAGTSKRFGQKGAGVIPPAPARLYHRRGKDSSRHFRDEMAAAQTIKIRFEKMIGKNTKEIDVTNLFKHTAHKFFLADPELAIIPINLNGEEHRIIKKIVHIPTSKEDLQVHFKYHKSFWEIKGIFHIQTHMTIQELKSNRDDYQFLKDNKIFCKQTDFSLAQCAAIEWLYGSHPFYSRQDDTKEELWRRMTGIKDC